MKLDPITQKVIDTFFGYSSERIALVEKHKKQIAHYTTADTAMKIIKGRSLWLRNAAVMNDHSEIQYGKDVMEPILQHSLGNRFRAILDAAHPNASQQVMSIHENNKLHARETVFMASLSEHTAGDNLGRLSMWRAYGGPVAGVALIFKGETVSIESSADLNVVNSPVFYGGVNEFHDEFAEMLDRIESRIDILKTSPPPVLVAIASAALQFAMLSIKHPGFAEEEEWRLIHRPYEFASAHMIPMTVTIDGIPQTIYELPFHNPNRGVLFDIPELNLDDILEGIIIGPCLYPETVFRAFRDEMNTIGIRNAEKRIRVSEIPLRQWR